MDRSGWHTTAKLNVPKNVAPNLLPSRAPGLNPVGNVWQYLRRICAGTGSQAASSTATTQSSPQPATPGQNSSPNRTPSHQSGCESGFTSVRENDLWHDF